MAPNLMISRVEGRELTLERTFNAPRELVFRTFTEAEHLKRWWGPTGWPLTVCNVDLRPGGVWHYCMTCTDEAQKDYYGMQSWGKAVYHEIDPPKKIIYADFFSDAEGNVNEDMPSAMITLTFEEAEGKTKVTNFAQYASADAVQAVLDMGMLEGITDTFNNLEKLLEELQA